VHPQVLTGNSPATRRNPSAASLKLQLSFHSFRCNKHFHDATKVNDRTYNLINLAAAIKLVHERAVNFELVDFVRAQIGSAGMLSSEVVQRDADTCYPQLRQGTLNNR
jgi:hypothetical protein